RTNAVEEATRELCRYERRWQAEAYGNSRKKHALTHDQPLDSADLRAQRDADADLPGAPAHRIAHDAVEADHGKYQAGNAEDAEKCAAEAWKEERAAEMLLHRLCVVYRHSGVESMDLAADFVRDCRGVALIANDKLVTKERWITAGTLRQRAEEDGPRV